MANKSIRWIFNFSKWMPSESDILLATACIQSEEKDRLAKFVFNKDFKSSLVGRLMMRKFINQITSTPYNEIKFGRDDKGKPILINPAPDKTIKLAFNVSHHGNYVVLAGEVGNSLLGVDVMKLEYSGTKSLSEYFRIMKRPFADMEWAEIKGSGSEKEQIAMFCRHWCLKESYVKAIGVGITINLQDICFKINTPVLKKDSLVADTELFVSNIKQNWRFEESLIDNEHCVAVALCNDENLDEENNIIFKELQFSDIVENAIPLLEYDEAYCKQFFEKSYAP
ncbi:hypothetical protein ILUMI_09850 [Ignelater luminosus]|uniref:L-aminoadipate-semialdehyde dehydrogenase-phosphopantetheinyl transferase n=1 Tax=Ignelater luminosus TaxID=2038154 RepID=A0A8K0D4C9_IGNLU|nr:hypothetical protein ILUMI_09850 [Ignelater luminosus]